MGAPEIERFLTALAVRGRVSASTQNQALSALLFLYRQVLGVELPWLDGIERAKKPQRLPVVLTREEATALLGEMSGTHWLMASLLYGTPSPRTCSKPGTICARSRNCWATRT
jgi:site-specific recombinase XerD